MNINRLIFLFYFFISCQSTKDDFKDIPVSENSFSNINLYDSIKNLRKQDELINLIELIENETHITLDNSSFNWFTKCFNFDNKNYQISELLYIDEKIDRTDYNFLYNNNKLDKITFGQSNQSLYNYRYDQNGDLVYSEILTETPDIYLSNNNNINKISGYESIHFTEIIFFDRNIKNVNYGFFIGDGSLISSVDSYFYFQKKLDRNSQLLMIKHYPKMNLLIKNECDNILNYFYYDNKLEKIIKYNGDLTPYKMIQVVNNKNGNYSLLYYRVVENKSLFRFDLKCDFNVDHNFNIQNISVYRKQNNIWNVFEKKYMYFYNNNRLERIQIYKREFDNSLEEKNFVKPDFKIQKEFVRF